MTEVQDQAPRPSETAPTPATAAHLVGLIDRVIGSLTAKDIGSEELQLLLEVRRSLAGMAGQPSGEDRRKGTALASESVLARACVTIDFLVLSGLSLDKAAQTITRQLLASGVKLPEKGGDVRGWRRILEIHRKFARGEATPAAMEEYRRFKQSISNIPAAERVDYVVGKLVWDRRAARRERRSEAS